ncbi:hypothetical protein F5884DRAFT_773018 [Xylogone sp. PMI_703]|nr:hypothetical protein F5884DRAFT_773018 [Xylogone sp. PMI_703]
MLWAPSLVVWISQMLLSWISGRPGEVIHTPLLLCYVILLPEPWTVRCCTFRGLRRPVWCFNRSVYTTPSDQLPEWTKTTPSVEASLYPDF